MLVSCQRLRQLHCHHDARGPPTYLPYSGSRSSLRRRPYWHAIPVLAAAADISLTRKQARPQFHDANFPVDGEGRTYHLSTRVRVWTACTIRAGLLVLHQQQVRHSFLRKLKHHPAASTQDISPAPLLPNEVAQRILSVGSTKRALMLAELLDAEGPLLQLESARGFLTVTGQFEGCDISIVSTMMGSANMDFVVRECRAVVDGPMAIVRLGTCGSLRPPAQLGSVVVATEGAISVRRDPDAFATADAASGSAGAGNAVRLSGHVAASASATGARPPYLVSLPVPAHAGLSELLALRLQHAFPPDQVVQGLNISADSFYSSQGRQSEDFDDRNNELLATLLAVHGNAVSLEMESFHLLDLARCSKGSIQAAAAAIVLAERQTNAFIAADRIATLEKTAGRACLEALTAHRLPAA